MRLILYFSCLDSVPEHGVLLSIFPVLMDSSGILGIYVPDHSSCLDDHIFIYGDVRGSTDISCLDDHIFIYINVRGIESRQNDIGAFQKIDPRMYPLIDNCRYRDYSRNEKNGILRIAGKMPVCV